jgi:hypothetical protein
MDRETPVASTSPTDAVDGLQGTATRVSAGQDGVESHLPLVENFLNTYQYQSLLPGHIRCLINYPGPRDSNIEVFLFHFSLHDHPRSLLRVMEALSYTWGAPTPAKPIHCRNEPGKIRCDKTA